MAANIEIMCINKTNRIDPHERIQYVGGINSDKTRWKLSVDQAIAGIREGEWAFHVTRGGHTVRVVIARSASGRDYLKTEADGVQPDNLLALPECPA